jgi:hypothetical protein
MFTLCLNLWGLLCGNLLRLVECGDRIYFYKLNEWKKDLKPKHLFNVVVMLFGYFVTFRDMKIKEDAIRGKFREY